MVVSTQLTPTANSTHGLPDISIPNSMAEADIPKYVAEKQRLQAAGMAETGWGGLAVRQWRCSECGTLHDRDVNAARNTLFAGVGTTPEVRCAQA